MSRTYRHIPTVGRIGDKDNKHFRPRAFGGGMVMSASVSGIWDDERYGSGKDRDAQRRWVKRGERQRVMREAA